MSGDVRRGRIAPQRGVGLELRRGATLTVIDPEGGQVADLFCFDRANLTDGLSSGRSIDYNETIALTVGHSLYASSGGVLLSIVEDTCGCHDFLVTPCSLQMFHMVSGSDAYHPSCLENLARAFEPYGIAADRITTTFNIFMNVQVAPDGGLSILPPASRPGDFLVLEACMDLIVGLTACAHEETNGGASKPITYELGRLNPSAAIRTTSA